MKLLDNIKLTLIYLLLTTCIVYADSNETISTDENQNNNGEIITFFPDKELALIVAKKLNKSITDQVSISELASIKGDFEVGPEDVANLKGIGYLKGIEKPSVVIKTKSRKYHLKLEI